jgi:hypothetical protein
MIRNQQVVQEPPMAQEQVEQRSVTRAPWSIAQTVSLVLGIIYVVFAGVALARTGPNFSTINHVEVAGLHHTVWLVIGELAFGLALIGMGARPGADRGGMIVAGILAIGAGMVIAIEPEAFHRLFGVHQSSGIFFAVTGAILLLTAMVAPTIVSRRNVQTAQYDQ